MMGLGMPELLILAVGVPIIIWLARWAYGKRE
jgi:hypothetical protein